MVLARYLLQRFFSHVLLINLTLTFLYNLIEFFEKMVRTKHVTTHTILIFILLNLIPSFFENLPISSWLASCMTLKEMNQQNEWETLKLLNVPLQKILGLVFVAGLALMVFNFAGKELATHHLANSAEQFKQKKFKDNANTQLFNKWFALKTRFCHFRYVDTEKNSGSDFSLFELSDDFKIKKVTSAPSFSLLPETQEVVLKNSVTILAKRRKQIVEESKRLSLPSFFTQLQIKSETPKLKQLFHFIAADYKTVPDYVYHQLLYKFLNRILLHLLLLFYPLLTFLLFFFSTRYRWFLILTPYPFAVVAFTATDSLMQTVQHGSIALLPYILFSACIAALFLSIRK